MIRNRRPVKSTQQLKEEQINFLLKDIKRKIEEDKKTISLRDNEIGEAKKFLREPKKVTIRLYKKINNLKNILKIFKKKVPKPLTATETGRLFKTKKTTFRLNHHQKHIKKYTTKN